jgi:hypothetical protein
MMNQLIRSNTKHLILHSSYLVANATQGFQNALLKQELGVSNQLRDKGIHVLAYVVHLHD